MTALREGGVPARRAVMSGASGLIGSALVPALRAGGWEVVRLVRRAARAPDEASWDPRAERLDPAVLDGAHAVVHLSGAGIADRRWTARYRAELRASRVGTSALLARRVCEVERPPAAFVAASAMGIYGDRGDEPLDEGSRPGTGFLAELAEEWEAAARPVVERGVRLVHVRNSTVLDPRGGALGRLLVPFRLGLGGPIGDGRAWWSWIASEDLVRVYAQALEDPRLDGAVNAASPQPVRSAEFARALGRALHRPAVLPAPAWALRALFGTMADEVLLASIRVVPARLERIGFAFRHPEIAAALAHLVGSGAV